MFIGITISLGILGLVACGAPSTPDDEISGNEVSLVKEEIIENNYPDSKSVYESTDLTIVDDDGSTWIDPEALEASLSIPESNGLTDKEYESLLFMREEEKLARDVYLTLYDKWKINIFNNIAASEQTHTDAVKTLLDQYGLDDPMVNDELGVFANEDLQLLYNELVAKGSQSLEDALIVGAAIEEIDIIDLEAYISQIDNPDIKMVYDNLMKGSRNHLRSFTSVIQKQTGITYIPQYLSEDEYQSIIGSEIERSGKDQGKGKGNR